MTCYAIIGDNLKLGLHAVSDSVNPISITRNDWQKVAKDANAPFIEIELVCSDIKEYENRIETRKADIPGHKLSSWTEVLKRDYEPYDYRHNF